MRRNLFSSVLKRNKTYAEGASFSGAIKKSIVLYAQWKLDVPEFPAVRPEYKIEVEGQEGQEGIVGTFTIPVVQTNGTISGVNYMLTTDPNANMIGVGEAAKDMYGMLIK